MKWPDQNLIAFCVMGFSSLGLVALCYYHFAAPERFIGRALSARSRHRAAQRPKAPETDAQRTERQKKDFPGFEVPRMELKSIPRILEVEKLLELAGPWHVIVPHKLVSADAQTSDYISQVLAILQSEIERKQQSDEESPTPASLAAADDLKHLLVLLKGNDIFVYADTHFKMLPERWEIPYKPDPWNAELQLIIAFWPARDLETERVEIQVDNGQPHYVRPGL
jgi:hypothetical protein